MRRAFVVGIVIAVLASSAVAVLIGRNELPLVHAQSPVPTPPPPDPGFTRTSPPPQARPTIYVVPAAFRGKIVHWSFTQSIFIAGATGPTNGQPIDVEAWVRFGPDGVPNLYHARATYEDGTFYQEVLRSPTEETTVYDPRSQPIPPIGSQMCVVRTPGDAGLKERLNSGVPPFVDVNRLLQAGFRSAGSGLPTRPVPTTPSPPGLTPQQVYGPDSSVANWILETPDRPGQLGITTLEVGADGYVRLNQFQQLNEQGKVENEVWTTTGTLEVYDPVTVPANAFRLSREGC